MRDILDGVASTKDPKLTITTGARITQASLSRAENSRAGRGERVAAKFPCTVNSEAKKGRERALAGKGPRAGLSFLSGKGTTDSGPCGSSLVATSTCRQLLGPP